MDPQIESSSDKHLGYMMQRRAWWSNVQLTTLIVLFVFVISIAFIPSIVSILDGINENIKIRNEALNTLPEIKKELAQIDIRMKALQNSDIGKRLSAIEKALEIGTLNEKEIKNINKLTQEVNVIQGYISNDVGKILELRDLQTKVLKVDNLENKINDLIVVKNDLSNFKTTTYLLAGLLFTMLFGSWVLSNRQKQSHTPVTKAGGVK